MQKLSNYASKFYIDFSLNVLVTSCQYLVICLKSKWNFCVKNGSLDIFTSFFFFLRYSAFLDAKLNWHI